MPYVVCVDLWGFYGRLSVCGCVVLQFTESMAGGDVFADVFAAGCWEHDAVRYAGPVELCGYGFGVFVSWCVVVGDDDDVGCTGELLGVGFSPFACTTGVGGGGVPELFECVYVAFAFDDVDGVASFDCFCDFG